MGNHSVINILCLKENRSFLPYHVFENYLLERWQGNTTYGYIFSMKKGKKNYSHAMEDWRVHVQRYK
jgi:hypothetical protein